VLVPGSCEPQVGPPVLVGIATANPGGGGDLCQTAIADGLQTGLHVIAAGVLLAITAALALPNRRISTATA
jgi:hypothetical protein